MKYSILKIKVNRVIYNKVKIEVKYIIYNPNKMLSLFDYMKREQITIDRKWIDMFWKQLNNGKWIYLSPKMIKNDMGYSGVSAFYRDQLRKKYQENIDYKEIKEDNPLIKLYDETLKKEPHKKRTGGKKRAHN